MCECFQIRTLHNIHTCKGLDNNLKVTEAWITRKYHNKVLANPKIGVDILVDDLKKKMHGVTVAPQKVYRAKRRILKSAMDYANVIKQQMPGALALLKVTNHDTPADKCGFQKIMVNFLGLIYGFKEGPFKGVLFLAVSLDANQRIFPIAICVCEYENTESWTRFFSHLQEYLVDDRQLTFMTDRQKEYLMHFIWIKCNHTTNNMTKSWNAWLGEMRKAPVIAHTRKSMMKIIIERRQTCLKWSSDIPAFINKKMISMLKVGRNYHVIPRSDALYEVKTGQYCRLRQISGLPYKHAMPNIAHIWATYEKCYAGIIHPLPDKSKWPHVEANEILPAIVDEPLVHRRRFVVCCSYCRGKKTTRILKHRKNLAATSSLESSFTGVNVVGNSASDGSAVEPSLNTSAPTPKQSTRGSATKEAAGISRGKDRRKNASTITNTPFDQFSVPPTSGIKIREGDKYGGTTSQSALVQTKRDLKGKAVAQIGCKFFLFL
ncbi:SWIM-type domain-containing protein [Citrus sinensis]|nr:SWIM-type domain-containing protein [Citrus sinensis]